jgi:4-methylaminobutanoate oxidase (formaldehyde-forming)
MTEHARAVIVGGGVAGTSIAYHLVRRGWREVVLLERAELTSGSTFHSAGLVGQLRGTTALTRMMMDSTDLYRSLAAQTGVDPGWREVGSLRLAASPERHDELRRQVAWARTFGLPLELIGSRDAAERFPPMSTDGVLGATFLPTDGWLDPSGLALALAAGARQGGAQVRTGARVVAIGTERCAVTGVDVRTGEARHTIRSDVVVLACGMYTPEVAALAGVDVPIVPFAHQYLFTEPIGAVHAGMPTLRDPDGLVYFREELGGLCLGGYEREPAHWGLDGIPADFNGRLLAPDWDRFEPLLTGAVRRVPAVADAGVRRMINGPEAFTPDGEFILGETEVRGLFVAAGFCAHGIAGAGGVGRQMAAWIVDGEPELDLWRMDIRRFGGRYRSRRAAIARSREVYATYYDIHFPGESPRAGRPLRVSPAYEELAALGARWGEKAGWERPDWFTCNEAAGDPALAPRGWAARDWSPAIGTEALATRTAVALFDESSFSKLMVSGAGAATFLDRLCANAIDRPPGSVVYTQLLDRRGGIQSDLTVTRLAHDRFLLITGTAFGAHDLWWLRRHLPGDGSVDVADVTSAWACLGLWGPRARDALGPLTDADLGDAAFPYLTARQIAVGDVPCLAIRVTYVGELGWELYAPAEYGRALWRTLWDAGSAHGLRAGGYRAIESLRLEKGYRAWSTDITPEESPLEAGLSFAVRMDKPGGFLGREALVERVAAGPRRRLRCLVLDDPRAAVLGNEPVLRGDEVVGRVTSGGYGYAVGESIAYAWVPPALAVGDRVQLDLFGTLVGAVLAPEPRYDPRGERVRGPAGR